jgi:lipoic acid synthetase
LQGDEAALRHLLDGAPLAVFAHNVECVPRLDRQVRDPRASFQLSLSVLAGSKRRRPELLTKSSLMIGLGEIDREVTEVMMRLREADVDLLTLGQYIAPGGRHLPVDRYVPPEQFDAWDEEARALGFKAVASGPLVRSSYRAGLLLEEARTGQRLVGRSSATTTGAASHEATPSGCCGTASPAQDVAVQAEALMKSALLMTKKGK